jgi:hypothetical protein
LTISNLIPKIESRLDTTHLNPKLWEANDANYEDANAPIANS